VDCEKNDRSKKGLNKGGKASSCREGPAIVARKQTAAEPRRRSKLRRTATPSPGVSEVANRGNKGDVAEEQRRPSKHPMKCGASILECIGNCKGKDRLCPMGCRTRPRRLGRTEDILRKETRGFLIVENALSGGSSPATSSVEAREEISKRGIAESFSERSGGQIDSSSPGGAQTPCS